MKTSGLIWQALEAKNVIVAQSDGAEIEGLMVIAKTLRKQSQGQLIGTTLIDHLIVNGKKFLGFTHNVFLSSTGELISIRRYS